VYLGRPRDVLDQTRLVLADAHQLIKGSLDSEDVSPKDASADRSVLSLYEELRLRLGSIEETRIRGLLSSVAENIEQLSKLSAEVERLRQLRKLLGQSSQV
jgi:hypothetical protein